MCLSTKYKDLELFLCLKPMLFGFQATWMSTWYDLKANEKHILQFNQGEEASKRQIHANQPYKSGS